MIPTLIETLLVTVKTCLSSHPLLQLLEKIKKQCTSMKEGLESAAVLYLHFIRSFFLQKYHNSLIEEHTILSGSLGTKLITHRLEFSCPHLAWVCKKTCLYDNGVSTCGMGHLFIRSCISFFFSPLLFPSHVVVPILHLFTQISSVYEICIKLRISSCLCKKDSCFHHFCKICFIAIIISQFLE